ncbi:hypothetical protein NP493_1246g00015 [Ridgeia piscesae]|uniref:Uncharacterized protein n=1 Tax=Ridgeia piscesae TaxID=27915 RepID=A0AAD9KAG0_RIDPI|nr:hypothetical protein NP493_1246g00015 [Ridgeia piscesae]
MCKHTTICASQRSLELHVGILSLLSNLDLGQLDSLQQLSICWDEVDDIVIGTTEGKGFPTNCAALRTRAVTHRVKAAVHRRTWSVFVYIKLGTEVGEVQGTDSFMLDTGDGQAMGLPVDDA